MSLARIYVNIFLGVRFSSGRYHRTTATATRMTLIQNVNTKHWYIQPARIHIFFLLFSICVSVRLLFLFRLHFNVVVSLHFCAVHCVVESLTCKDKHLTDFDGLMHSCACTRALQQLPKDRKKASVNKIESYVRVWHTELWLLYGNVAVSTKHMHFNFVNGSLCRSEYELHRKGFSLSNLFARTRQQIDFYVTMSFDYQTRCVPTSQTTRRTYLSHSHWRNGFMRAFDSFWKFVRNVGKHKNAMYSHVCE